MADDDEMRACHRVKGLGEKRLRNEAPPMVPVAERGDEGSALSEHGRPQRRQHTGALVLILLLSDFMQSFALSFFLLDIFSHWKNF